MPQCISPSTAAGSGTAKYDLYSTVCTTRSSTTRSDTINSSTYQEFLCESELGSAKFQNLATCLIQTTISPSRKVPMTYCMRTAFGMRSKSGDSSDSAWTLARLVARALTVQPAELETWLIGVIPPLPCFASCALWSGPMNKGWRVRSGHASAVLT
eukprot:COSAG02_NODE_1664_length_11434_cov_51.455404_4_plen_156_part_00